MRSFKRDNFWDKIKVLVLVVMWLLLVMACATGYIDNLTDLLEGLDSETPKYALLAVRVLGVILIPLGCIMGWVA